MNKDFVPSKAAQNCLNFIKREDERAIILEPASGDAFNIIRIINILLNEKQIAEFESVEHLYYKLMPKYGVKNMSNIN